MHADRANPANRNKASPAIIAEPFIKKTFFPDQYRTGKKDSPAPDLPIANIEFCKDNIVVPEAIHKVIYLNKPIVKEPPFHLSEKQVNEMFDFTSNTEGNMKFRQARAKDLVFNFFRYGINRQKEKTAHWTKFNKKLYSTYKKPFFSCRTATHLKY